MKKKLYKKAQPKEDKKFPSNYRNIPEKLNRDEVVFFVGFVSILVAILIVTADLYSNFAKQKLSLPQNCYSLLGTDPGRIC